MKKVNIMRVLPHPPKQPCNMVGTDKAIMRYGKQVSATPHNHIKL